ncbi:MFS transporter [Campylobacter sp. RM9344]|uniref:MFS transporter n=1 Tax=Campylobacter californiensis TaxID=1032243 RepID=A0AAW3ZX39_9BACT|nr:MULTISPECIES: MFS transporter [unclassified Campylobacter]MBE2984113.1 MFS transporter [Campylobacter sp. RM6883]MBE2986262.1 MFS transporter [Campylobacter sp. RM12919]MBE2988259.1 MFS transporter [Campylobacter sp. RM12920]MBE2995775.1 MFS transporter [Campylobacter sp. RM6913]MBE3030178.1 MFS transporter [Campylobacter sp. RM9344]
MFKSVLPISFIIGSRFFGIFIILPVISLYALELDGSNEFLIGVLIGVYALMQVIFQIPFGYLSDRFGRKVTLLFGLLVFIVGGFICAWAQDIYTMILGRLVQGVGAIGGVATALISDNTKEEMRGKAMAIMGGFIGVSFALSMLIAPAMSAKFGLSSLFYLSIMLTFLSIILLYTLVPKEQKIESFRSKTPFFKLISNKNLFLMNTTNFMQKMLMSVAFLIIPIVLVHDFGWDKQELWKIYSISTVFGFMAMGLGGAMGEKRGLGKQLLLIGILLFIAAYLLFGFSANEIMFCAGIVMFFIGFNLHEPIMQSIASKFAKAGEKGAALGVFNSSGFMGTFIGGVGAGALLKFFDLDALCGVFILLCIVWLILLTRLDNPALFKNLYLELSKSLNLNEISQLKGIVECYKTQTNYVIKYNSQIITQDQLKEALGI